MPPWIYLSPHFDDIALSCGGLVWQQKQSGAPVEIWTICGGQPGQPFSSFAELLHARWGSGPEAVALRQAEDIASCQVLGAGWRHFPLTDCIYRTDGAGKHLYASEEALWAGLSPQEQPLIQALAQTLRQEIPAGAQVICPLTLGDHVDHQLVRAAAELSGHRLWYYADFPYAVKPEAQERLAELRQNVWQPHHQTVSPTGLHAWQASVAAHGSQISSFWPSLDAMRQAMQDYWQAQEQGVRLWMKP